MAAQDELPGTAAFFLFSGVSPRHRSDDRLWQIVLQKSAGPICGAMIIPARAAR